MMALFSHPPSEIRVLDHGKEAQSSEDNRNAVFSSQCALDSAVVRWELRVKIMDMRYTSIHWHVTEQLEPR